MLMIVLSILSVIRHLRPVIKENTAHVVAACQDNVLLLCRAIRNLTTQYYGVLLG